MSKTRNERRRRRRMAVECAVFWLCLLVACGLPQWLTWAGL